MINLQSLTSTTESLTVTATLDSALCVGAGGSSGSLADKPIVRTAEGKLLIPASQLKGRLRHECEKLARGLEWPVCRSPKPDKMCPQRVGLPDSSNFLRDEYRVNEDHRHHCIICQIFGNPVLPSRVDFEDLVCSEPQENLPEVLRPGVTINRRRGTAEDKKLYFLETSPANLQLAFKGKIHLYAALRPEYKLLIWAALKQINALGGSKSAGLGWLNWQFKPENWQTDEATWKKLLAGGAS